MSTPQREPTEQELQEMRDAYEAELKHITVGEVVIQTAVSLLNLGGRRLGLVEGAQDERDLEQVRDSIDGVRALMGVLERRAPGDIGPLRDALAQLQMAYARAVSDAEPGTRPPEASPVGAPGAPDANAAAPRDPTPAPSAPPGGANAAPASGGAAGEDREGQRPGPAQSSGRLWIPGR